MINTSKKIKVLLLTTVLAMNLFLVGTALATDEVPYTLLEPLPKIESGSSQSELTNKVTVSQYTQYAFNLFIAIAAATAVFMIIWGGFEYITTDSWQNKNEGRSKVINALIGLLMVLGTYLLLKTVNPQLVNIPSSLVQPLDAKCPLAGKESLSVTSPDCKDGSAAFFDNLLQNANGYTGAAQQAVDNARQAKNDALSLEQQKQSLCDQLSANQLTSIYGGVTPANYVSDPCSGIVAGAASSADPQAQALAAQISNIDNQINQKKIDTVVNLANSKMDNSGVSEGFQGLNMLSLNNDTAANRWLSLIGLDSKVTNDQVDTVVNSKVAFINGILQDSEARLDTLGAYDQKKALEDKANQDMALVGLAGVNTKLVSGTPQNKTELNSYLDTLTATANKIQDSTAKATLTSQISETRTKVSALPNKYGTDGVENIPTPSLDTF